MDRRLLPPIALVVLAIATDPVLSPDGIEMAAAGRCIWALPLDRGACEGLEPLHWPPAFPLLAGGLSFVMDLALAAMWASLVAAALLLIPLSALAARGGGPARRGDGGGADAALFAPILFLCTPALRAHASMGEARSLAMLGLFAAAALICAPGPRAVFSPARSATIGLLVAMAQLARPEAALAGAALLALLIARARARALPAVAAALGLCLPYWGLLSWFAGHPVATSRGWQSGAYGWLYVVPLDWLRLEVAAGTWGTPLRSALSTAGVVGGASPTLDPAAAASWMAESLSASTPLWMPPLAALGAWRAARTAPLTLLAMAIVGGAALAINLLPYQDTIRPANNLLPALAAGVALSGVGLTVAAGWIGKRARRRLGPRAIGLAVCAALALAGARAPAWLEPEPPIFRTAAGWIAQEIPPGATVGASLITAPLLLRAGLERRRLPAPWTAPAWADGPEAPELLLFSHLDQPSAARTLQALLAEDRLELVAHLSDAPDWLSVYRLVPADQSPGDQSPAGAPSE